MWARSRSPCIMQEDRHQGLDRHLPRGARHQDQGHQRSTFPWPSPPRIEGEIIRKERHAASKWTAPAWTASSWSRTKDAARDRGSQDHPWTVPSFDEIRCRLQDLPRPTSSRSPARTMQSDFESRYGAQDPQLPQLHRGRYAHRPARHDPYPRLARPTSRRASASSHIGEVLYAKIKSEFDTVVDKCQVKIVRGSRRRTRSCARWPTRSSTSRDDRLQQHDGRVRARVLHLHHVPGLLPEPRLHRHPGAPRPVRRRFLAGRQGNERARPAGSLPGRDRRSAASTSVIGRYEDVDEAVQKYSHGALEHVTLYSLFEDPMTSCGCFECICGIEPCQHGRCHHRRVSTPA